jgi:hypothetical protein
MTDTRDDDRPTTSVARPQRIGVPVPRDLDDWHRQIKIDRTLNDHVEDIHRLLMTDRDSDYAMYLDATSDDDAIEGSLSADNLICAQLIREKAREIGKIEIVGDNRRHPKKLATLVKAMNVVLRRYRQDRKTRANTIGGEQVHNPNTD